MSDINWSQERNVWRNTESDEIYVQVPGGMMELDDYIEGGQTWHRALVEPLVFVGKFTNAQMSQGLDL